MTDLRRNLANRHGNAVLGPSSMSGIKALVDALLSATDLAQIKIEIDADSLTLEELYGPSGQITAALESSSGPSDGRIIVIKGGNDQAKSECMHTVLDDNKKLVLEDGKEVHVGLGTRILYLWDSVSNLSPATLSRVDIVYLDPEEADFN